MWRMTGGVVVEISKDVMSMAHLRRKPPAPAIQNTVIVATRVFGRPVKAHINERADHHFPGPRSRHIVEAERNAVAIEQLEDLVVVPAWFPELDDVLPPLGKRANERRQPFEVDRPMRRKLVPGPDRMSAAAAVPAETSDGAALLDP